MIAGWQFWPISGSFKIQGAQQLKPLSCNCPDDGGHRVVDNIWSTWCWRAELASCIPCVVDSLSFAYCVLSVWKWNEFVMFGCSNKHWDTETRVGPNVGSNVLKLLSGMLNLKGRARNILLNYAIHQEGSEIYKSDLMHLMENNMLHVTCYNP